VFVGSLCFSWVALTGDSIIRYFFPVCLGLAYCVFAKGFFLVLGM
jgi:hypothetical protein